MLSTSRSLRHTLLDIASRRTLPALRWRAVLLGLSIAVVIGLVGRSALAPIPGLVATIIGVGLGGYVAGKWADSGGLYHGAVVGMGWIALEALAVVPTTAFTTDALQDTVILIALDVVTLFAGAMGGYLARPDPSSSSDTGRGR
jgi:hypothetical protein